MPACPTQAVPRFNCYLRVPRCWGGLARRFCMLDGYCRWAVVRLAWLLPSERNGRVSGVLMAWVGRLRARASNCRLPIVLSLSPGATIALRVVLVSCVAYLRKGIRSYCCPFPPDALFGCGVDARHATCSSHALPRCGAAEAHGAFARALGCGMSCMGAGSRPLLAQAMHLSLDTNDCRGRLEPRRSLRAGRGSCDCRRRRGMLPG